MVCQEIERGFGIRGRGAREAVSSWEKVMKKLVGYSGVTMAVLAVVFTAGRRRILELELFKARREGVVLGHMGKEGEDGGWLLLMITVTVGLWFRLYI